MSEQSRNIIRKVSVVAATVISLACGTNYAYSAWAPQFESKMSLNKTQINLIGNFGNLGMYASGIPVGLLVDAKGPRPGVLLGSALLGIGYFFLYKAALNWPEHRGSATAFPLSAFGLSALFFSTLSSFAFPNDTSDFLLLLAIGTFGMSFVSSFFLRVVHDSSIYSTISRPGPKRSDSNRMHHTKSDRGSEDRTLAPDETSSLISESPTSSQNSLEEDGDKSDGQVHHIHHSHHVDIRGLALLPRIEFWQLFSLLGLLTGIGLMTINNIGNDAQALWSHFDDSVSPEWIEGRQLMHVSIISFMSFIGRLLSGIGSDLIVKKLHMSRFWCLFISSAIFCAAQVCAAKIDNPNNLFIVSGLTGLAYGFLFGVYPSLIAETFGVHGLSQNWGCMTLAPVISGNIFNLLYGTIYDARSSTGPDGSNACPDGLQCYSAAYWVTFGASIASVFLSLWCIRHSHVANARARRKEREDERP